MMKKYKVDELKPGMKFTRAVYITPSSMLVPANVPIREEDIKKLKRLGVKEVESAGEPVYVPVVDYSFKEKRRTVSKEKIIEEYKRLSRVKTKYKTKYENLVEELKRVFQELSIRKRINEVRISNISTEVITNVITEPHIFIFFATHISEPSDYLVYHSINVAIFSVAIAHFMRMEARKMELLARGAVLHDVGMLKVPSSIREKTGKLTPKEFLIIKTHPIHGYKIIMESGDFPVEIPTIAIQHHEQYDGNGYPRKLKGEQISLYARIVGVADTYEAMTKRRSYRDKFMGYDAMRTVLSQARQKFDPEIIRIFLSNLSIYPLGSLVRLNTGAIALVIGAIPDKPLRPIVKIVFDEFGDRVPKEELRIIDLSETPHIFIAGAVDESEIGVSTFDLI